MKPIGYLIIVDGQIEAAVYGSELEDAHHYWLQYKDDGRSTVFAAILDERQDTEDDDGTDHG